MRVLSANIEPPVLDDEGSIVCVKNNTILTTKCLAKPDTGTFYKHKRTNRVTLAFVLWMIHGTKDVKNFVPSFVMIMHHASNECNLKFINSTTWLTVLSLAHH